ncbi:MAG: hypothetical protein VB084_00585 [Syntrophomonadaceae bacterium]|nr:hypothetical protein [Syntrophomonadaceae bacterium]
MAARKNTNRRNKLKVMPENCGALPFYVCMSGCSRYRSFLRRSRTAGAAVPGAKKLPPDHT